MLSSFLDEQEVFTDCSEVNTESAPPDPQLSTVTLLMQFDANPLKDPISDATWILHGDAYIDTVDKKIGSGALRLSDAVNSYAQSPVLTNMYTPNVSGKTITVEFWFKKTSSIGNAGAVCFQDADNPSDRYSFFMRSGADDFKVAVYTTSTSTFIDTTANLSLNEWVHFAYVEGGDGVSRLYINGIEIANAYDELADGQALRARFERDNQLRKQHNLPQMPIDEHLLAASDDLIPCSGIAVGIDRLLMVITGASSLEDVIPFPSGLA